MGDAPRQDDGRHRGGEAPGGAGRAGLGAFSALDGASGADRAAANAAAVEVLATISAEGREATEDERRLLAGFSGWGASSNVFRTRERAADGTRLKTVAEQQADDELRGKLGEADYAAARHATLTSFYTPPEVASAVVDALAASGFGRGRAAHDALEPGCGSGTFFAALENAGGFRLHGVELDPTSAAVARALFPDADVVTAPMQDVTPSAGFSLAVGNVPFLSEEHGDDPQAGRVALHDYFVLASVRALRPGGVAALLTSSYTMDKSDPAVRRALACLAEAVDVVRLPQETFEAHAGTSPKATDLLVLRRRESDLDPSDDAALAGSLADDSLYGPADTGFGDEACRAFLPGGVGHTVGELQAARAGDNGIPRPHSRVSMPGAGAAQVADALRSRLMRTVAPLALASRLGKAEPAALAVAPREASSRQEYALGPAGDAFLGHGDAWELAGRAGGRLADMVALRDAVRALYDLEADPGADDARVAAGIGELRARYDAFTARWGLLNSAQNRRAWDSSADRSLSQVTSLELYDSAGRLKGLSDALASRVVLPDPPRPERVDDPLDALHVCLDELGRVDLPRIASLLGTDEGAALGALGDAVVMAPSAGPDGGTAYTAELAGEWLSGDLGARLDEIDRAEAPLRASLEATWHDWVRETIYDDPDEGLTSQPYARAYVEAARLSGAWGQEVDTDTPQAGVAVPDLMRLAGGDFTAVGPDGRERRYAGFSRRWSSLGAVACIYLDDVASSGRRAVEGAPDAVWGHLLGSAASWGTAPEDPVPDWAVSGGRGATVRRERSRYVQAWVLTRAARMCPGQVPLSDLEALVSEMLAQRDRGDAPAHGWEAFPSAPAKVPSRFDPAFGELASALAREAAQDPARCEWLLLRAKTRLDAAVEEWDPAQAFPGTPLDGFMRVRSEWLAAHEEPGVRDKLAGLEALRARVEASMPGRLTRADIRVELGSPWVPADVYRDFLLETFAEGRTSWMTDSQARKFRVEHDAATGSWSIAAGNLWAEASERVRGDYGTVSADGHSYTGVQAMLACMNNSEIKITRSLGDDEKADDPEATMRAQAVADRLNEEFKSWVWSDPARASRLEELYNRRHNRVVPRRADGSHLTFPGMSAQVELRPHQRDAVARVLQAREGTLLAHVVGAGKTYTGIAAMHESKRLGRCRKPLVVVQGSTLGEWEASWARLYPRDRVLVMGDADNRGPEARERFWATVRANDWDAVVVPHSAFDEMDLSPDESRADADRRQASLVREAAERKRNGLSTRQEERARARAEAEVSQDLKHAMRAGDVDSTRFDQLGVDALLVDEAHYYKNLGLDGSIDIPGVSSSGSGKCQRFRAKLDWMRRQGHGANIVFMTGTPVSNSMTELYKMERYLAPGLLESTGFRSFSDWANTFGDVRTDLEVDVTGDRMRNVSRLSRFVNVPELMGSYRSFADVVGADDVRLPVPECDTVPVAVEPTEAQRRFVGEVSARADAVRAGKVDPREDNMLKITSDGRYAAASLKMLARDDPSVQAERGEGKLDAVADNVARIWREEAPVKGTQLVFSDIGVPNGAGWDVYSDLKGRLVERGVPADEVAWVRSGMRDSERAALFAKVRDGEVRVLMGSTELLGTGVNVQDRLAAIHNVDCPWRPSDIEQRRGRVQRQGNCHDRVASYHYVTQGTFDSYMYQTVERKARFIAQLSADPASLAREADDLNQAALDYATIKELTVSDPAVAERTRLANAVSRLAMEETAHARAASEAERRLRTLIAPRLEALERRREGLTADPAAFAAASSELDRAQADGAFPGAVVGGLAFGPDGAREANRALIDAARGVAPGAESAVGSYLGLQVWATVAAGSSGIDSGANVRLSLRTPAGGRVEASTSLPMCESGAGSPAAQLNRLAREGAVGQTPARDEELAKLREDARQASVAASAPFPKAAELAGARASLAEADRAMEERGSGSAQAAPPARTASREAHTAGRSL